MRLSNTLLMSESLMPAGKKAFTLAEVLITLSILGVVAALTIPSLVNRQSDLAAQVKLKKAISNYEDVIGTYMAEREKSNAQGMLSKAGSGTTDCGGEDANATCTIPDCANKVTSYFKAVSPVFEDENGHCNFVTADGVAWNIDAITGNAAVTDNEKKGAARYQVVMWNANNRVNVNNPETSDSASNKFQKINGTLATAINNSFYTSDGTTDNTASLIDTTRNAVLAPEFLQGVHACKANSTSTATDCSSTNQIK